MKNKLGGVITALITPFDHQGRLDEAAVLDHFKAINANTDIPVIAYDIPMYTHTHIAGETRHKLMEMDGVVGLKDSSGNFADFTKNLIMERDKSFSWIQGGGTPSTALRP